MSDQSLSKPTRVKINPSRTTCEEIIRRILSTEEEANGKNKHFKTATDFLKYFESLYPSGPALTKQVQRAIKSLDLAKDEDGYFLINKTKTLQNLENELGIFLTKANAKVIPLPKDISYLFLKADEKYRHAILAMLDDLSSIDNLYITAMETHDGILFMTDSEEKSSNLSSFLEKYINLHGSN